MSALQARRARLLASLYVSYGEAALWTPAAGGTPIAVTIRRRGEEVDAPMGASSALVWQDVIRVRRLELAAPARGDRVALETGETVKIIADPRQAKAGGEWVCEYAPVRS